MAYGDFIDLPRRMTSDKVLLDKAFNNAKNSKYVGYPVSMASMFYKVFDKMSKVRAATHTNKLPTTTFSEAVTREIVSNQQLTSLNCTKHLLENSKNGKYTHLLIIIYWMHT